MCTPTRTRMLFFVLSAAVCANDTRFVHRRACFGNDMIDTNTSNDMIGCAERAAALFEHSFTPSMLWCNTTHCSTRFGDMLDVHAIDCNDERCHVLVHCQEKLDALERAAAFMFLSLIALIVLLAYQNTLYTSLRHADNLKSL